jgi:hypothetical protein
MSNETEAEHRSYERAIEELLSHKKLSSATEELIEKEGLARKVKTSNDIVHLLANSVRTIKKKRNSDGSTKRVVADHKIGLFDFGTDRDYMDDGWWRKLLSFRSRTDQVIRRSRIADCWEVYKALKKEKVFKEIVKTILHWDYIAVMNTLWMTIICEKHQWFKRLKICGVFELEVFDACEALKVLNNVLKSVAYIEGWPIEIFCENASLSGFRNPPVPGFKLADEAEKLAGSGSATSIDMNTFNWMCRKHLTVSAIKDKKPTGLLEDIRDGAWATSGSSSVGKLSVLVDQEKVKIKCRKNMVPYMYTPEQLYDLCLTTEDQINTTITKSELGKVRLAVGGDLATYLKMNWLLKFLNRSYVRWKGIVLEETEPERQRRILSDQKWLKEGAWGLPFDFASFDHQATTEQIVAILSVLFERGRRNVPDGILAEYDLVVKNVLDGFDKSWLVDTESGRSYRVTGGLMSGLRVTSLIGNAWNLIVTEMVLDDLAKHGVKVKSKSILGDDASILFKSQKDGWAAYFGYRKLGILPGVGKFSVLYKRTEFLRQTIDQRDTIGYVARAVPLLSQRKPWSNEPWDPTDTPSTQLNTLKTISRRVRDTATAQIIWSVLLKKWLIGKESLTEIVLIPRHLGGLGLIWNESKNIRVSNPLRNTDVMDIKLRVLSPVVRNENDIKNAKARGCTLRPFAWSRYKLLDLASGNGIPAVTKALRNEWLSTVRRWMPKLVNVKRGDLKLGFDLLQNHLYRVGRYATNYPERFKLPLPMCKVWGSHKGAEAWVKETREMLRFSRETLTAMELFKRNKPAGWGMLRHLRGQGVDLTEGLTFISGGTIWSTPSLNDKIKYAADTLVASVLEETLRGSRQEKISLALTSTAFTFVTQRELQQSQWYRSLYMN